MALREALTARRMTPEQLAAEIGADPKTIGRWLTNEGRVPHPRTRWAVADALGVDEVVLWPDAVRGSVKVGPDREIVRVYPTHSSVPDGLWRRLIGSASDRIDLVGYAPYWLTWQVPGFVDVLRERATAGAQIRAVIGDPDSPLVAADERATGAPLTLTTRIQQTVHLLAPLAEVVQVRQSSMGFGRSVYRFDDELIADLWIHGAPGSDFPALHVRRQQDGGMFDQLVRHVDALWDSADPIGS